MFATPASPAPGVPVTADTSVSATGDATSRLREVAVAMAADWMGQRFFRTFRPAEGESAPFDARLRQRDRAVGVTFATLWDEQPREAAVAAMEALVATDLAAGNDDGAYVLWAPPGAALPEGEPQRSELRLALVRGLAGLAPGQRREVRLPVQLRLAKVEPEGAYMMVTGVLSSEWAHLSEGVRGVYHLDARDLLRLPEEPAEMDIILSRIRDRAAVMVPQEVTEVAVHDYWVVSRLPVDSPRGLTVVTAPRVTAADPDDGTRVRRSLRRAVRRASEARAATPEVEFGVLVLLDALGHIKAELATQALRGMSPASYGAVDEILLVADGQVREVLQPRELPWGA